MIKRQIEVSLSPQELAYEFSVMDSNNQAVFFSQLIMCYGGENQYKNQLSDIEASHCMTPAGRSAMAFLIRLYHQLAVFR